MVFFAGATFSDGTVIFKSVHLIWRVCGSRSGCRRCW
jgi:hypothetical protein